MESLKMNAYLAIRLILDILIHRQVNAYAMMDIEIKTIIQFANLAIILGKFLIYS